MMFVRLQNVWRMRQRRRELRRLRESLAFFGYSLSGYSDAQLLRGVEAVPQITRASCTTPAEAAYIYQQVTAGGDEA